MPEKNTRYGEATDVSALKVLLIFLAAVVVTIVLLGVWMLALHNKGSRPDYRDQSRVTVINDATDRAQLDAMRRSGVDLSRPVTMTHLLYVPSEGFAQDAEDSLRGDYTVTIEKAVPARPDREWLVIAMRTTVPTMDYLRQSRLQFEDLAIKSGGDYAGWAIAKQRLNIRAVKKAEADVPMGTGATRISSVRLLTS